MRMLAILILAAVVCWLVPLQAQEGASRKLQDWKITPEEAARENPLKPDNESLEQGRILFQSQCGMCHGATGDGKGSLAEILGADIADLRNPATLKDVSDGAVFAMVTKGKGEMPGAENRLTDEQKWKMVNYMRALPAGGKLKEEPSGSPAAPAPAEKKDGAEESTPPRSQHPLISARPA
ncbi:MAG: cytochrome c [Acidobacteria bacterium]|nr:cytochrome c [Acidobacteriota bacterium]